MTKKDTNGVQYQIIYDTALVVADTMTFQGRTNVTEIRDKYYDASLYPSPTIYFGTQLLRILPDANGGFLYFTIRRTRIRVGTHIRQVSKVPTTVKLGPDAVGTDLLIWSLTATASYTGPGTVFVGESIGFNSECSRNFQTEPASPIYDDIDLRLCRLD